MLSRDTVLSGVTLLAHNRYAGHGQLFHHLQLNSIVLIFIGKCQCFSSIMEHTVTISISVVQTFSLFESHLKISYSYCEMISQEKKKKPDYQDDFLH